MKLVVDLTRCQGYAQCAFLAPSVVPHARRGGAAVRPRTPTTTQREQVLRAAAACPVQAIGRPVDGPRRAGGRGAAAATR